MVTENGIKMDLLKVEAILKWPQPIDGKEMQRFLGAANFNCDFSEQYARIAVPIEGVQNQKGLIKWTPELLESSQGIKGLFASNLELHTIDWKKEVYLTVDACLVGIGAWIGQKDNKGKIVPVVCVSKKLSATQQQWSATKRELYGLM